MATRRPLTVLRSTSLTRQAHSHATMLPSRNEVAILQPALVKQLENDVATAVVFRPRWLLTDTRVGHVKMWIRPLPAMSRKNRHTSRAATEAQYLDWVS